MDMVAETRSRRMIANVGRIKADRPNPPIMVGSLCLTHPTICWMNNSGVELQDGLWGTEDIDGDVFDGQC